MSSPLNEFANSLPQLLLGLQDMKMRQDAQEALSAYRQSVLANTIDKNEMTRNAQEATRVLRESSRRVDRRTDMLKLEDEREGGAAAVFGPDQVRADFPSGIPAKREVEGKDSPEASIIGKRIEEDLKTLRNPLLDPGVSEIDRDTISAAKTRTRQNVIDYREATGRDYPIDLPAAAIEAPAQAAAFPTPASPVTLAGLGVTAPGAAPSAPTAEPSGTPAGFPDPATLPEGQPATFNGAPWVIRNGQWVTGE